MNQEGPDQAAPLPSSSPVSEGPHAKRAPDWLLFFSKFLRHGMEIASFIPSSVWVARALVGQIDWTKCRCVVELGAGTGPITAELLRLAPPTCKTVIVERDPDFCARLRERFPDADIVEADVADLDSILNARGIDKVDHFLCGLPLPSFPKPARELIFDIVRRRLAADGDFRQLTHMPYIYYILHRRYFQKVRFQFVLRNLPPAGFYICQGARAPEIKRS